MQPINPAASDPGQWLAQAQAELLRLRAELAQLEAENARLRAESAQSQRSKALTHQLAAILDATTDLVGMADARHHVTYLNQAWRTLLGIGATESLAGLRISDLHPPAALKQTLTEGIPTARRAGLWQGESALLDRRRQEIPVSQVILAHLTADGQLDYLSTIARDITQQKQIENQLRRQEADFLEVQRISRVASFNWNLQTDCITWTPEFFRIVERDPGAFPHTGTGFFSLIHPEDQVLVEQKVTDSLAGQSEPYVEYRFVTPDGRSKFIVSQGQVIYDENAVPVGMIGYTQDITERRQIENELRASKDLMSMALQAAKAGAWQWDFRTHEIFWSDENFIFYGLAPQSIRADYALWQSFVHPDDRLRADAEVRQALAEQRDLNIEYRFFSQQGQLGWSNSIGKLQVDQQGQLASIHGIQIDITERKQAEAALLKSEQQFREILENLNLVTVILDQTGNILFCNDYFLHLIQRPCEQVTGRNWFDEFISADIRASIQRIYQDTFTTGAFPIHYDNEIQTPTGPRAISWTNTALHNPQGNIISIASIGKDMTETLRAETARQESAAKYRRLHESMRDAFATTDMVGQVQDVNSTFLAMLGYTEAELRQLTYEEFTPERWHAYEKAIVEQQVLQRGYSDVYEKEYRHKEGRLIPVELRTLLIRDEAGQPVGMWAVVRDITERKKAEEALRISEEKYRLLVDNQTDMMVKVDMYGRFLFVSPSYCEVFGKTEAELIGRNFMPLVHEEDQWATAEALAGIHQPPHVIYLEQRALTRYGWRWLAWIDKAVLDDQQQVVAIVATGRDITERKQAEQALVESERKYRELVENANSIIVRLSREGEITFMNEFGLQFFGYPAEELIGLPALKTIVPKQESSGRDLRQMIDDLCQQPERYERNINENVRRNGERVWVAWTNKIVLDAQGQVAEIFSVGSDITERKRAEEALRREQEFIRALLENMMDGVVACNADGQLVLFNKMARDWHGVDPMSIPQSEWATYYDLFATDGVTPLTTDTIPLLRAYRGERLLDAALVIRAKGQPPRYVTSNCAPFYDTEGRKLGAVAVMRDLTETRRAEEALHLTQFAVDHSSDAAYWMGPDGRFIYVNEAACQNLGYLREELLKLSLSDIRSEWSADQWSIYWRELREHGSLNFETLHRARDGRILPVEIRANFISFAGNEYNCSFARNITERKQAEASLRQSEAKFRRLIEASPLAMGIANERGVIEYLNPQFTQQFGYTLDDVPSVMDWYQRAYPDPLYQNQVLENWMASIKTAQRLGTHIRANDVQVTCRDGSVRIAEVMGTLIDDRTLAIFNDITERKRAENLIKASLQEKEVLLKEVHHRVKNNLQVIYSLLELQTSQIDHPAARSALRESQNRVRSMALIHERLYQSGNLARIDFADYLKTLVTSLFQTYVVRTGAVQLRIEAEPLLMSIDKAVPCGLIINELVSNALRHGFPDGRSGELVISLQPTANGEVLLRIMDTGIGFPAAIDFRNTQSLGLMIVNTLVKQVQGRIDLDREQGTAFRIVFANEPPTEH